MQLQKIRYWNSLRRQLNLVIVFSYLALGLLHYLKVIKFQSVIPLASLIQVKLVLLLVVDCLFCIAITNFFLLLLEFVDRYLKISSRSGSLIFRWVVILGLGLLPLIAYYLLHVVAY
jgi:hypothetical protein